MPILIAQNLTTQDVYLGDLYTKVPRPQDYGPCQPKELGILTTFRSAPELMRSPALHKAIAEGKLAIGIQFTQDEIDSEFDIWPGLRAYGTNLVVKDEGSVLTSTASSIDFVGAGVTATVVGNDVMVTIPGGGGSSVSSVFSADTTGVTSGRLCYISSAGTVSHSDAGAFPASLVAGAYAGTAGEVVTSGLIDLVFSDVSPVPSPGYYVFAERADAEPLSAAAGKARTSPVIASGFVVPVGVVHSVAIDYVTSKKARVALNLPGLSITKVGT